MPIYTNSTPQATQTIAFTQPLILDNFAYLPIFANKDHNFTSDTANTSDGFHKKVTFLANTAAPGFGSGAAVLYLDTVQGVSGIWLQNLQGAYAITGPNPAYDGSNPSNTRGITPLPGGLMMTFGIRNIGSQSSNITYGVTYTSVYSITCTLVALGPTASSNHTISVVRNPSNTSFTANIDAVTATYPSLYWMAIGTVI